MDVQGSTRKWRSPRPPAPRTSASCTAPRPDARPPCSAVQAGRAEAGAGDHGVAQDPGDVAELIASASPQPPRRPIPRRCRSSRGSCRGPCDIGLHQAELSPRLGGGFAWTYALVLEYPGRPLPECDQCSVLLADIPANRTMNAAFDKYFPGLRTSPELQRDLGFAVAVRSAVRLHGAKAGGLGANGTTPTSAQLVNGLNSLKNDTLEGTAPPLTFTAGQPHPVDCWFTALMKDGKASLPDGLKVTCEQ